MQAWICDKLSLTQPLKQTWVLTDLCHVRQMGLDHTLTWTDGADCNRRLGRGRACDADVWMTNNCL